MKTKADMIVFCLLALFLIETKGDSYVRTLNNKAQLCKECTKYCPNESDLCCASPSTNQWTCFPTNKVPITCSLQNMCQRQNKPDDQKLKIIPVTKWLTSSGGQPTFRLEQARGKSMITWNSLGFAPAWIQLSFQTQFVKKLHLRVAMLPNGRVMYKIIVDGQAQTYTQNLITGTQKTYKINKYCSKIRIVTLQSPSWIAWDDILISG